MTIQPSPAARLAGLTATGLLLTSPIATAAPNPDRPGTCYLYEGDRPVMRETCTIGTGYGAGAHYAILNWSIGVITTLTMINNCPAGDFDAAGFCEYTLDDYDAEPYARNAQLAITTTPDPNNVWCYRAIATGNSVCYRFDD